MKIGYDAKRIVHNGTGLGNYGRTLINSLSAVDKEDELLLYAPDKGRDDLRSQIRREKNVGFRYPRFAPTRLRRDLWRRKGIVGDLVADGVELFHGLSGELPMGISAAGIPSVVTIHDLIFMRHPEYYSRIDAGIYRRKFYETIREATHIIAISECTKRDILYYGNVPEEKITVIYQSASPKFNCNGDIKRPESIEGVSRYMLQVGTIEERKNALEAVQALEYLPVGLHLVLVGGQTPYTGKVAKYAMEHGLDKRVHILSGIDDNELARLYRHAECFVYPSRYEGFGIPIVEAIQCGLPVVAAKGSCLDEAGGSFCKYVSPDDAFALADAVMELISSPRLPEIIAGEREYVRRFENNDVASQVQELYHRIVYESH